MGARVVSVMRGRALVGRRRNGDKGADGKSENKSCKRTRASSVAHVVFLASQ